MRLAELGGEDIPLPAERPSGTLRRGSSGNGAPGAVLPCGSLPCTMMRSSHHHRWLHGPATENAVRAFQKMQGPYRGWHHWPRHLECPVRALPRHHPNHRSGRYLPRHPVESGSRGDNVRVVQEYLNTLARAYPLPRVAVDSIYGPATENAVQAFQRLFGLTADGIVGSPHLGTPGGGSPAAAVGFSRVRGQARAPGEAGAEASPRPSTGDGQPSPISHLALSRKDHQKGPLQTTASLVFISFSFLRWAFPRLPRPPAAPPARWVMRRSRRPLRKRGPIPAPPAPLSPRCRSSRPPQKQTQRIGGITQGVKFPRRRSPRPWPWPPL